MKITREGEVIAFYLESEIVCPGCITHQEQTDHASDEWLAVEELEGAVDELWCDRCDAGLMAAQKEACCS